MSSITSEVDPARVLAVADKGGGQAAMEPKQESALQLLQAGRSMVETAQTVGVARATIYNWLKHDPVFLAAYNQWHDEIAETTRSRVAMLSDKAVGALDKALDAGDAKAALQLLKGLGMIRPRDEAERITDAREIDARMKLAEKKRKVAIKNEDNDLTFKESLADLGF